MTLQISHGPSRIKPCQESLIFRMVLNPFFPCISIGPFQRTGRWWKVGKQTQTKSLFSWVTLSPTLLMCITWNAQTGVFSATVAAFLVMAIPSIQPSSRDISVYYLANIYQQVSTQPNGSDPSIPSIFSDPIEPFTPPTTAVWVNALFFLSLVISLTCALLATLVQQWARRYLRGAYPRCSPHKQARLRAFYRHGVQGQHMSWTMEAVPVLLHISVFLFFSGLSLLFLGVNSSIFKILVIWVEICAALYAWLTLLPILRKDSPYSTPLSPLVSFCLNGMSYVFFRILPRFPRVDPSVRTPLRTGSRDSREVHLDNFFSHSMSKTAEQFALNLNPDIDYGSLLWTFESLNEDTELEKFFERLPQLCDSEIGNRINLKQGFIIPHKKKLSSALIGLMSRTLPSNLVTEFVKQRRVIICTKTIESTSLLEPWWILCCVLFGDWYRFLGCIEFGLLAQNWRDTTDKATSFSAQCVAALTISMVRRDERWIQLASGLLNVPKPLLSLYTTRGDSILLANAIFIVRRTIQTYSGSAKRRRNNILNASSRTLGAICKLDFRGTLPELQHEFCHLWNQLVATAQTDQHPLHHVLVSTTTLKNIRKLYINLHESTYAHPTAFNAATDDRDPLLDNPESYPECTIHDHRPILPVLDLQFDEPTPDPAREAPPTPDIVPIPIPTFPYPPALDLISSVPSHYGTRVDSQSYSATPLGARVPFTELQLTPSHASNVLHGRNVQRLPPPVITTATITATEPTTTAVITAAPQSPSQPLPEPTPPPPPPLLSTSDSPGGQV